PAPVLAAGIALCIEPEPAAYVITTKVEAPYTRMLMPWFDRSRDLLLLQAKGGEMSDTTDDAKPEVAATTSSSSSRNRKKGMAQPQPTSEPVRVAAGSRARTDSCGRSFSAVVRCR